MMLIVGICSAYSDTHYVSTSGGNSPPYTNWAAAAASIQDAVDAAADGDTVLVTNGIYSIGGAEVYSMSNRVALTQAVTLQSVNGPEATFIVGAADPVSTNGPAAVRCAYLTNGAVIVGFTLTNGHTRTTGDWGRHCGGGGIWLDRGGTVTNCTFSRNSAEGEGGGAYCSFGGTLNNCTFRGNVSAIDYGGGAFCSYGGMLNNCTFIGNSAESGGGAYCYYGGSINHCMLVGNVAVTHGGGGVCNSGGTFNNCVLSGNSASFGSGGGGLCIESGTFNHCTLSGNSAESGGGAYCQTGGIFNNCILWGNSATTSADNWDEHRSGDGSYTNTCTTPVIGTACVTNDPLFAAVDDYKLQAASPCIDAAIPLAAITDDIEGTPRSLNGDGIGAALPDIGAYEHSSPHYSTDGDPHTDHEEYIADTDPTDSNHSFRIAGFSAGVPSIIWFDPASVNRQYSLLYSTNLTEGLWMEVAGQIDIAGSGGTNSLAHTNSFPAAFYRVDVELIE